MKNEPVLITATSDGSLSIWNTKDVWWKQEEIEESKGDHSINRLSLSLDKLKLAAACSDSLKIFDIRA